MTLRPSLRWAVLAVLSAGGAWFAWRAFPSAFSLVSLDLRMDRNGALAAADSLARAFGWAPREGARQVARFEADGEAQTFIELEGGGRDTLLALLADHRLAVWLWEVRRFRPGETGETRIRFRPDGQPWSFVERVPEAAPGAALEPTVARALAEREARGWGIAFDDFAAVESARQVRPSGRVDHTFVYQRPTPDLGEGSLRLRLVVSGDRVTEITPFVQVPESFTRRYAHMRSANEGITLGALAAGLVLYGGLGIGVGLFIMLRRRRVLWRAPAIAGLVFGVLMGGALANALPLTWMDYDTADPATAFWLEQLGLVALGALLTALQVGLSAAAAETLSRAAFPGHPQFWQLWSRPAGASTAVLERTGLGFLLVGLLLAWGVGFALVSRDWQGWWSPSDTLLQPDQLATVLPWLGPVALSFHAGFWEECLFRAIPLAGAALLGERYGRRRLWIGAALVLQAVIFAGGHAAYPAQPAYARVVELMLPSFLFGALFLRYGLLPAVILHAGYDLVLTSVPLFVAETPGILVSRVAVIAAGALPLAVVLWRRLQAGRWIALPAELWNAGWRADALTSVVPRVLPAMPAAGLPIRWLVPAGALGLAVWVATSPWTPPIRGLDVSRGEAVRLAREAVEARGATLDPAWKVLAAVSDHGGLVHRFVWETAGDSAWRALLGDALPVPQWRVRFARFEGDVAERAEEWVVRLGATRRGSVEHRVPEGRAGASVPEARALQVADSAIVATELGRPERLRLVSVEPHARPARTDWEITFADTGVVLPQGEVRVAVSLAGDAVTGVRRFVHVPEAWAREWEGRRAPAMAILMGTAGVFGLVALGVVIAGVVRWARTGIDTSAARTLALVVTPIAALEALNSWPAATADFETALPWGLQVGLILIGGALALGGAIGACAVVVGAALPAPAVPAPRVATAGALAGMLAAGLQSGLRALANGPPPFPELGLDRYLPVLHWVGDVALGATGRLAALLVVLFVGERLRHRSGMQRAWYIVAGAIGILVVGPAPLPAMMAAWMTGAAALLLLDRLMPALGRRGLVIAVFVWALLASIPGGQLDDPVRWLGLTVGAVAGLVLVRRLDRPPQPA